jgi:calcium/calmodulin-dependent protein kinase (CaM kinase) II
MPDSAEAELLALTQRLLDAIDAQDWAVYSDLCDSSLTSFEPEAAGSLIDGLRFHQFYFELPPAAGKRQSSVSAPRVRILGDAAVVAYVRVVQRADETGASTTAQFEETRVWQRRDGCWKHVHFHRSHCGEGA